MSNEILIVVGCVVIGCGLAKALFGIDVLDWVR